MFVSIIGVIVIIVFIVQVNALLEILELTDSVQRKGQFAPDNGLVLGHNKHNHATMVCSAFTATRSLRNPFTAATYWTTK